MILKLNKNGASTEPNNEKFVKKVDLLNFFPIGTLYFTTSSTFNPSINFGGTWELIDNKYIKCIPTTETAEATGGNTNITLTSNNVPSLSYTYTPSGSVSTGSTSFSGGDSSITEATGEGTFTQPSVSGSGTLTFSGKASDISISGTTSSAGAHTHYTRDCASTSVSASVLVRSAWIPGAWGWHGEYTMDAEGCFSLSQASSDNPDAWTGITGSGRQLLELDSSHSHSVSVESLNHTHFGTGQIDIKPKGTVSKKSGATVSLSSTNKGGVTLSSHTHTVTSTGSVSNTTAPSFTGTAQTLTIGNATPTSISIIPPSYAAYCWHRVS